FREFVALEPLARHPKSGMPLAKEFRRFFLDGEPLLTTEYWEEGIYGDERPPDALFSDIARAVQSRFFTMDVARRAEGDWLIVELGDGQVAGLPQRVDVGAFYQALAKRIGKWCQAHRLFNIPRGSRLTGDSAMWYSDDNSVCLSG